jgi:GT2 family glycosyltransferase
MLPPFLRRLLLAPRRRLRPEAVISRAYRPAPIRARPGSVSGPLISIILPVCDTPADLFSACIASVRAQTWRNWQLCIADDASTAPHVAALLAGLAPDPSCVITRLPTRSGIAAASNAALALASGDYACFLDHDDLLAPHALATLAHAAARHPDAGLLFSDEDQLLAGRPAHPYFKPGWNPDLLLAQNAVGHLTLYRRNLLTRIGGLRPGFDGSQDWELALRAAASTRVLHVPEILYHWRQTAGSFSALHGQAARSAGRRAVQAHLPQGAYAEPAPAAPHWVRAVYPLPSPPPLISLLLPAGAEPPPPDPDIPAEILRGLPNRKAAEAKGDILVLLAPGLRAPEPGWLRELASHALRPEIAAAGLRIDAPDRRIAQSGLILDPQAIAQTLRPRSDAADPGYFGQFVLSRTVSAISSDCLAIRRALFLDAGGLDAECGPYADVDLCLRLAVRGLRCVWTPHARLAYTRAPRAPADPRAAALMRARWGLERDAYLNPNLAVRSGTLAMKGGKNVLF